MTEGIIEAVKDVEYLKTQFGDLGLGSGLGWFKIFKEDITITCSMSIWSRGLGSSFILGHGSWGRLGTVADGSQPYLGDSRPAWTFRYAGDNMVFTDQGIDCIIRYLGGQATGSPAFIQAGSDNTTPTSGDTALGSAYESSIKELTSVSSGDNWIEFETVWPATEPTEQSCYFREVGLFTGSPASAGSMMQHSTFTAFEKTSDIELQSTIKLQIS